MGNANSQTKAIHYMPDNADIDLLAERYQVAIDKDDVRQYKLCMVIMHLEAQLKASSGNLIQE
jgi:hypothetical protein